MSKKNSPPDPRVENLLALRSHAEKLTERIDDEIEHGTGWGCATAKVARIIRRSECTEDSQKK